MVLLNNEKIIVLSFAGDENDIFPLKPVSQGDNTGKTFYLRS